MTVLERGDLLGIGVHAEDFVADVRHAGGVHGTQISGPNDGNAHTGHSLTMQHKRSVVAIRWDLVGESLGKIRGPPRVGDDATFTLELRQLRCAV